MRLGREAIIHVEDGSRTVKVGELWNIAHELMRPLTYFLLDEEPEQLAVVAHRGGEGTTRGVKKAELWLRQRLADFAELHYLFNVGGYETAKTVMLRSGDAWQESVRAALEQRKLMGLGHEPIRDLCDVIEDGMGVPIFGWRVNDDEDFCGMLLFDRSTQSAAILVNSGLRYASRRRFTIAHEFGHYIWKTSRQEFSPDVLFYSQVGGANSSQEERFANNFAAHFMAPDEGIRQVVAQGQLDPCDPESVMRVGAEFGLSFQTTTYRLQNMELIGVDDAERLRETTRPTLLRAFRSEREPFATVSSLFHRMVIEAYFGGSLSAGRCAEMVDMTTAEFTESLDEANKDARASKWVTSG